MKNQATAFIEESRSAAPNKQMMAELEALKARNAILEEDLSFKKSQESNEEGEFAGMSIEQIREFITTNTGAGSGRPAQPQDAGANGDRRKAGKVA